MSQSGSASVARRRLALTPRLILVLALGFACALLGSSPGGRVSATAAPIDRHHPSREARQLELDTPADAARTFSQLEADRDFETLYDLMHPDARAIVPRSAVIGWYESYYADRETSELTVTGETPAPWTWGVTGVTYDDAVTVTYTQPYTVNGVTTEVAGEVHLVPNEDEWAWLFGASKSFVDEQIALYGDDGTALTTALEQTNHESVPVSREEVFPDPLHADIDRFWAERFQAAGTPYDPPRGVVGFDEPIVTACGRANPQREAAFYCVIDEKIYYSVEFRDLIERQIGDFAWVVVVAHEWGHHVQAILGFDLGVVPDRAGEVAPLDLEQQADCFAGAYSIDAETNGWLDPGDIEEALDITNKSGDPPGTAWNDPGAHGTGEERIDAFLNGYDGGLAACGLDLTAVPAA